jgi:predicted metalloprotease with PDZ domain
MSGSVDRISGAHFAVILLLAVFAAAPAQAAIRYHIRLQQPKEHLVDIEITIPKAGPGVVVALPAWNALYQIRDFSYRVREVHGYLRTRAAISDLSVSKLDKQTWQIGDPRKGRMEDTDADVGVRYTIEWNEPGPFSSQFNSHHAFLNLAEVLMYVPQRRAEETLIFFNPVPDDWRVISELSPGLLPLSFVAPSYDALVDAPVEAGKFEEFDFDNGGAHFRVVVDGDGWSKGRLENALRRITGYELKLMGGPPFKEYTFIFHFGPYLEDGGGGMEHANSTAIAAGSVEGAISIAAHEFFHVWNVKRLRPQALEPVDYAKEQYTRALWFAEGLTSAYGSYTLERSGLWSKDQLYADLAQQISELEGRPAHAWQSAEESSLDAWYEKYEMYNRPDRSISYYNKGEILGVLLDLQIRNASDNRKSLDDVLRKLNLEYAQQGKYYDESEGIRAAVDEVAGVSFAEFFHKYVAGTMKVPYGEFLTAAGLALKQETRQTADLGFWPGFAPGTGMQVTAVEAGGRAEAAGLRAGDLLLRLNGEDVMKDPYRIFRTLFPGQNVKLHVRRGSEEIDISYQLGSREDRLYTIAEMPNPSDKQRRIREGLLHGTTD